MQTILVIDDEEAIRRAIVGTLKRKDYRVIEATSGETGFNLARTEVPDLILSDVNMEDGDGYALLARLREDPVISAIPIIIMTGKTDEKSLRRAMESGADDYLAKPFGPDVLLAAVGARLNRRSVERTTRRVLGRILEATSDYVCVVRIDRGEVVYLNAVARTLVGIAERGELEGWCVEDLFSEREWERVASEGIVTALAEGRWTGDSTLLNSYGREIPASLVILTHRNVGDEVEHFSIVARDISEQMKAQQNLADSNRHLRDLAARLVSIQETERARIAREVHDEFGQQMTGLKIDLTWLEKRLREAENLNGRAQWLEKAATMHGHIQNAIQTGRRIATELRPGILDSLGLIPALEWQAAEFQKRTGVSCEFNGNVEQVNWDPDRSIALFRIFQETLTNVARHSQATAVTASLEDSNGIVTLVVKDNGVGIADLAIAVRKSTGMLGMRERAFLLDGSIAIESQPGKGTTVTVKIPRAAGAKQI